ncbi:MAG: TIGR00730 family Rossman fold protein [Fidelibacterota bacterium]
MRKKQRQREKFYKDLDFLTSPDARPARLLSEYFGPLRLFKRFKIKDTIVFFGSARIPSPEKAAELTTKDPRNNRGLLSLAPYYEDARKLAFRLTKWSKGLRNSNHRFIVTSGGGGGIMEAACRGASEADGYAIGLNISLPYEQQGNPYITDELDLEFHYFFMRKFWFLYLAKAMVIFPGGFGTLDELMELLTLIQTGKIKKKLPVVIYGRDYWNQAINLEFLSQRGTISEGDLNLFHVADSVDEVFDFLTAELTKVHLRGANF